MGFCGRFGGIVLNGIVDKVLCGADIFITKIIAGVESDGESLPPFTQSNKCLVYAAVSFIQCLQAIAGSAGKLLYRIAYAANGSQTDGHTPAFYPVQRHTYREVAGNKVG